MSIQIRALPDRVVLEFPPEITKYSEVADLEVPDSYRLRKEMGKLVAHGPASNKQSALALKTILRLSGNTAWQKWRARWLPTLNRWLGWRRPSCRFLVPIMMGSRLWNDDVLDKEKRYEKLTALRSYSVLSIGVAITSDHDADYGDVDAVSPPAMSSDVARAVETSLPDIDELRAARESEQIRAALMDKTPPVRIRRQR